MSSGFAVWLLSVGVMVLGAIPVSAQDYPNKTIRIMTPTAGGGSDFASRTIAQGIAGPLGQPVIVENRAGLEAQVAVAKAPPDGYTLLFGGQSIWIGPLLRKVPYDPVRDFSPILVVTASPNALAVHPSLPVKSVKELIALAKAKPGALNYATSALGGSSHLAAELIKSMAGVDIVQVPYKGSAASITAVISGEVQMIIQDPGSVAPHVKSGKLRALAVTSPQPSALFPGLPTVAASGLPGFEAVGRTTMFAPAKTPAAIIKRLNQEIVRVLNLPDVKEKYLALGVEVVASSPEQLAATVDAEIVRWSKVIKDAGIKVE